MTTKTLVSLEGLGLCEHCGALLSIDDMPGDSIDADWACQSCEKILSHVSFGFELDETKKENTDFKKIKWVGPDGQWVSEKPVKDFDLGDWSVQAEPIQYPFY
ncbi:hypothetical protein KJ866_04005 [Patescibacteria group bacterium]|nr:hypothetical protein [Patescibacteria group bacterium]MBU2265181.1 hypothetical protein [Patescibacteria group bacterium]